MATASFDELLQAFATLPGELHERLAKPFGLSGIDANAVLGDLARDYVTDPARWQSLQQAWYEGQQALWHQVMQPPAAAGDAAAMATTATTATSAIAAAAAQAAPLQDRRFSAAEWRTPYFAWLAQSYLLTAQWLTGLADGADLGNHKKKRAAYLIRQWIHATSPANFAWSNPEALRLAAETQGDSLLRGLANLRADLPRGIVSMTDESAFEVGRNLAVTPGAVVHENALMQLIQYSPATPQVYARPLLMVPPFINKFYVLDLQPENSLVRHAVAAGHTVFMVSWRNMPASLGRITWDDYVGQGVIEAITAATRICGVPRLNTLGFCVGGTLLASALAVLRTKRRNPVASMTLLATMLDFCDTGELSVFIDRPYVEAREREFAAAPHGGVVPGSDLALTFASLRPDELIWQYVVNNYLKGRTPPAFDLLHWNSDSTNLPGAMYAWYIRHAYLENSLKVPGRLQVCGVPLDLARIDTPAYLLATREDHIVPWRTAYASTALLKGRTRFVLAASGHIAGVINPASRNKRNYWTADALPASADEWLAQARTRPGSWWTHWSAWLSRYGGKRVAAPAAPGGNGYAVIEAAPGRYARERTPPVEAANATEKNPPAAPRRKHRTR